MYDSSISPVGFVGLVFAGIAVLLFVVVVLQYAQIRRLECYLMSRQDPGAYVTSSMTRTDFAAPEPPTADSQEYRDLVEYGRLILGGTATPAQILAHEAKYGTKEDIL
jgi:hypothetical protein